jgi:hypothetical protein
MNLYHWSTKIDNNKSHFHASNREEDKINHLKAQKMLNKDIKTLDDKIKEIDASLSQLILTKKTRRVASLQIEREALSIPKTSENTEDYIDNILVATESGESNIKVRVRPKKASCKKSAEGESAGVAESGVNRYNLRSNKKN